MPLYEQSYRRYEALAPQTRLRFWPITREAVARLARRRALLLLLVVAWLPLFGRLVQVFFVSRTPELAHFAPLGAGLFGSFLGWQVWFALFLSIFGGAGLVAEDLRTGGILVYLSRPLTRRDYLLGKLGVLLGLNLSVTLVPALLLYLAALALAPSTFFKPALLWIGPAIVVHSLVIALALSLPLLAASALTSRTWVAGVGFFAVVVTLALAHVIVAGPFNTPAAVLFSLTGALDVVGSALFGSAGAGAPHWAAAAGVLTAIAGGALLVLRARIRAVEIVR
jgi:ABC-type transport system involved in multi-copper enzyme maturation permease subunit